MARKESSMAKTLLQILELKAKAAKAMKNGSKLTKKKFTEIRNSGDEEALIAAVEEMAQRGGYDCLDDGDDE